MRIVLSAVLRNEVKKLKTERVKRPDCKQEIKQPHQVHRCDALNSEQYARLGIGGPARGPAETTFFQVYRTESDHSEVKTPGLPNSMKSCWPNGPFWECFRALNIVRIPESVVPLARYAYAIIQDKSQSLLLSLKEDLNTWERLQCF